MIQAVKRKLAEPELTLSRSRKGFCRVSGRYRSTDLPCCAGIGHKLPAIPEPQSPAERLLTSIVKDWVIRVTGAYGCDGGETSLLVQDLAPDLCKGVGQEYLTRLCYEINHMADKSLSEWLAGKFYEFNHSYFGGCLEAYEVLVVYNIFPWISESPNQVVRGRIDSPGRRIVIALSHDYGLGAMEAVLLHLMAHAKTNTSTDDFKSWKQEMARIAKAGADVFGSDVDD